MSNVLSSAFIVVLIRIQYFDQTDVALSAMLRLMQELETRQKQVLLRIANLSLRAGQESSSKQWTLYVIEKAVELCCKVIWWHRAATRCHIIHQRVARSRQVMASWLLIYWSHWHKWNWDKASNYSRQNPRTSCQSCSATHFLSWFSWAGWRHLKTAHVVSLSILRL